MVFRIGQHAVYPLYGVGVVQAVAEREIGGMRQEMYILRIVDNGMRVMVPVAGANQVGLRPLMQKARLPEVFAALLAPKPVGKVDAQTWNRRHRDYMTRMRTGDPVVVAEVLLELVRIKAEKNNLSFGERKIYDSAWSLLMHELALVRSLELDMAAAELEQALAGNRPSWLDDAASKAKEKASKQAASKAPAAKSSAGKQPAASGAKKTVPPKAAPVSKAKPKAKAPKKA